ncbi:macrophage mannose receptor 1-like [Macrobrachium nipponense]|uniref:macrophage mannose receptor 1-like n=1 Tax=Macrobrachium nipponense TaxID=159736 RepID=UPI0030C7B452
MTRISDDALWIGGRAKFDSGYEWIDGSPFDFDNWALGEPNNYLDQEDCISLYTHRLGNWNDLNCALLKGRMCKRVHGSTLPPPSSTPVPDGHCPEGWTHTGSKCLKMIYEPASNNYSRNACKALHSNSDLVSIHSKQEQAHVMAALGLLAKNAWIGLRQDREFVWYDQTPVTFTNWASGEPDGQGLEVYCVEAYYHSGQWNDINCDYKKPFICQLNQDPDIHEDDPPLRCETPFDNYISYRGSCYRAVSTKMTWQFQEAEKTCQNDGSHLASTHDLAENALVWTLSQNMGFKSIWIGFNNIQDNKVFKWSDGWPSFYTNWAKNQPDISAANQSCVRLDVENGLWYTTSCAESRSFACKFKDGAVPTPDPPVTGFCPDERWLDLGGGYCYLIVKDTKSWNEANMNCVKENSNLASIHSEDEMKLLLMAIKDSGNPVWIGLIQKIDGFGWSDGSGLDFVNWDDGEPSSDEEQCAQVDPGQGTWNDADCSSVLQSVCKKTKTRIPEPTNPTLPPRPGTTTHPPDGGSGLSSGAIIGIVTSALVIIAGVGFIGLTFVNKKRSRENYAPFTASFGGQSASRVNITTLDTTDA